MSKRLGVLTALKALLVAALPGVEVLGLDGDDAELGTIPEGGRVVLMSGDPGDAQIDLSPLTYNYDHPVPISISVDTDDPEAAVDAMMVAIGVAVEADRTLGGLCTWLEPTAPLTEYDPMDGARVPKDADLMIVASYSTTNPLN